MRKTLEARQVSQMLLEEQTGGIAEMVLEGTTP